MNFSEILLTLGGADVDESLMEGNNHIVLLIPSI